MCTLVEAFYGLLCKWALCLASLFPPPVTTLEAWEGSPPRFLPAHKQQQDSHILQRLARSRLQLLLAPPGFPSSNSSCGSTEDPGEAISHLPRFPKAYPVTGRQAAFSGSHSPIHGHSARVPRMLGISPGLQQHDHL